MERRTVRYSGNVQGVGFRWTTRRIAGGYEITGTVRNCPDGTVEVIAEGNPDTLDSFLAEIRSAFGGQIRDEKAQTAPAAGSLSGFQIVH